jgi:DNA-binding CsgD family transcriptional regulator
MKDNDTSHNDYGLLKNSTQEVSQRLGIEPSLLTLFELQSNAELGICVVDEDNKIVSMNSIARQLCQLTDGQICSGLCRKSKLQEPARQSTHGFTHNSCAHLAGGDADTTQFQLDKYTLTLLLKRQILDKNLIAEFTAAKLTAAEIRIALLRVNGVKNKKIAEQLFISSATLKTHLHSIFQKLPAHLTELLRASN